MAEGQNPRIFHPDGSLKKIEEAPPSRFTVLGEKIMAGVDRFNKGFDKGLDRVFGGKKESSGRPAGPIVRPSQATEAMRSEIAGESHPGTDEPFIENADMPYNWKDDNEVAESVTPVTELANAATYLELQEAKRRRPVAPKETSDNNVVDLFAPTLTNTPEEQAKIEMAKRRHPSAGLIDQSPATPPALKLVPNPEEKPTEPPKPPTPPEGPSAA